MKTISQRSEFVTSDYRHKLIQALDFRNRFAERPFLCNELILPDQIVVSREHACVFFKLRILKYVMNIQYLQRLDAKKKLPTR